jgi:prephenate dehydrogenase
MKHTVGIAGLGLIGGSLAKAIKAKTDSRVFGFDIKREVISAAKEQGAINGELTDASIAECSLVIIALYPDDVIAYFERSLPHIRGGTIVVDCGGVKTRICEALSGRAKEQSIRFIGGHPMAGIERSGFSASFAELFTGATMILCEDASTDKSALEELRSFFLSLGFGSIKITNARDHDEIIAYTSQLAHIVSSAYIKSDTVKKRYGFSAGSFKDLTRVARLNEDMWTKLFFENRENLLKEADAFLNHMRGYRDAIASLDYGAMKELLKSGTERKITDDAEEEKWLKQLR